MADRDDVITIKDTPIVPMAPTALDMVEAIEAIHLVIEATIVAEEDDGTSAALKDDEYGRRRNESMVEELEGCITSSQVAKIDKTDREYGYIGIETSDNRYLKLKVDFYTDYDTLDRGEDVIVKYEPYGSTHVFVAKEIRKKTAS